MKSRLLVAAATAGLLSGLLVTALTTRAVAIDRPTSANILTKGMNTKVTYTCQSPAKWRADATNQIDGFLALGANAVDLVFPLYTKAHNSDAIFAKSKCGTIFQSPSAWQLGVVVNIARAAGLTVFVRPLLSQVNLSSVDPSFWHGNIHPANPTKWFANYEQALTPYLIMSQTDGVQSFAISDEFASMAQFPEWHKVIGFAASIYSGQLIFTSSWSTTGQIKLREGTALGLDTYRPVSDAKLTWSPKQLLAGWDHDLREIPVPDIKQSTIDEIGIAAQDEAYKIPNGVGLSASRPFNQLIQANWFTTACAFVIQHKMRGLYYWGSTMTANGGLLLQSPDKDATGEIQPMAQRAIKNCFGVGAAPVVTTISPESGSTRGGTRVSVKGHNFLATFSVSVGSAEVPFTVVSGTRISFTTPRHGKGAFAVVVTSEAGASQTSKATAFVYKE